MKKGRPPGAGSQIELRSLQAEEPSKPASVAALVRGEQHVGGRVFCGLAGPSERRDHAEPVDLCGLLGG
jgi:hypothetical protein